MGSGQLWGGLSEGAGIGAGPGCEQPIHSRCWVRGRDKRSGIREGGQSVGGVGLGAWPMVVGQSMGG